MTDLPTDIPANAQHDSTTDQPACVSRNARRVAWLVYVALLIWYLSGAFPVGATQGDAFQDAAGVEHIARFGWDPPLLTHNFVGCPGLTWTLVLLRQLTGIAPISIFCYLSVISGLIYLLAGAGLVRRLTQVPFPICGLVVLLSPVAIVAGMYTNDMVSSSALVILAMYFFAGPSRTRNLILGAIGLAFAGFFRADAVLITPAVPFLLYRGDWRRTARDVFFVGLGSGLLAIGLVYLSGSSVTAILGHAEAVAGDLGRTAQIAGFYVSFFPLLMLYLLGIGLFGMIRDRSWRLLGVFLAGVVPLWYVHLTFPFPKYFTHVVPWFALVCTYGLERLLRSPMRRQRRLHLAAIALLFVGQYVLGLRITLRDKPWRTTPEPTPIVLYERRLPEQRVNYLGLVVGLGTLNPFGHAGTPVSGILFTPITFSRYNVQSRRVLDACVDYVRDSSEDRLVFFGFTHGGVQTAVYALAHNGYRCLARVPLDCEYCFRYDWVKGDRRAVQFRIFSEKFDTSYLRTLDDLEGVYIAGSGRDESTVLAQTAEHDCIIREQSREVRAIYEVRFPPPDAESGGNSPTQ